MQLKISLNNQNVDIFQLNICIMDINKYNNQKVPNFQVKTDINKERKKNRYFQLNMDTIYIKICEITKM